MGKEGRKEKGSGNGRVGERERTYVVGDREEGKEWGLLLGPSILDPPLNGLRYTINQSIHI